MLGKTAGYAIVDFGKSLLAAGVDASHSTDLLKSDAEKLSEIKETAKDEPLLLDKSEIFKELDVLNINKINHIIDGSQGSDQQWEKLVPDKNWRWVGEIMKKKLKELILSGEFIKAKSMINEVTKETLETILFEIGCDEESICSYTFLCFLILENESVEYHCLASEILNIAFPHLPGGYQTSLYHIRKAVQLKPEDKKLKETLLFFNEIPEKLINDEEANIISKEISEM